MINNIKTATKTGMDSAIDSLKKQLGKVRTGKANTSMLDPIRVDYYGSPTPLNQVAAVSCPDGKSFLIAPWEVSILKEIEQSIVKSDIGMTPINDGKVIRLKLPDLTEERRKDLAKQVKKMAEDARVSVRQFRKQANEEIKTAQKDKAISEDDAKRGQDEVQKLTDDYITKVDTISAEKEKEILTI
jgi:ribosome recycling factor